MLLAILFTAGCARPAYYARPYDNDGAMPYDGTDPAAEQPAFSRAPAHYYKPPGPAQDPWGPYIREAVSRYRIPERWIRAVMHQESGGQEQAISSAGAMGLMQVMPATYAGLQSRYRLGSDPYDPHDNILAGAAYIREMYDRYGAPGFLAAYNAGPDRLDQYLAGSSELPSETVNYLAAITPNLGSDVPFSGPLAVYASAANGSAAPAPTATSLASGCDADAAYDPDRPCAPLEQAASTPAPASVSTPGAWGIQVGAFDKPGLARAVAEGARAEAPDPLRDAAIALPTTTPFGGAVLYRARLMNLSAQAAENACAQLNQRQLPCVIVRPEGA